MPLQIKSIRKNTIAEDIGLQNNDTLISINNHQINDIIDYQFYQADEFLSIKIQKKILQKTFLIEKDYSEDLGLEFNSIKYLRCNCNCIFCFVDQMHPEARPSLKIKDDDYRFSFLFGNYISLTNLSDFDYSRIINQRLSPLYISVHTTNDELRKKIMRYKGNVDIKERMKFLAENGIQMHAQIVLIPDWNEDFELERTIFDLADFYPSLQSIAIVPVGLTKFRKGLTKIKSVNEVLAKKVISDSTKWRESFMNKLGMGLVTLADEFFFMTKTEIPEEEYYCDFPQIENGVGMTRKFLSDWEQTEKTIIIKNSIKSISFITAELIYPIIKNLSKEFKKSTGIKSNVIIVGNNYLGKTVTVTGLLAGCDVIKAINENDCGDLIILPQNMFNADGITLDGITIEYIRSKTEKMIKIV